MLRDFILVFVLYEKNGEVLAFFIVVHIDAKKLLKMFAFWWKSETKFLSVMVVFQVSFYYRVKGLIKPNKFLEYEN